jgi:hypothetical protein
LRRFAGGHPKPLRRHGGVFPSSGQAAEYLLLRYDTGTALYATETEIHRANAKLRRSGNRNRYVAARHLPYG